MKRTHSLLICLAGGLALNAAVRAEDAVLPGNPYAPVVTRNIFDLNPPPKVDPNAADATPPPKITPNGITDILGQLQVLFKVANPAKPGKPAAEDDYILSEGQRQDEIEVVKIDQKAGVVTFKNHGETQELPLVAASPSSTPAPVVTGIPANPAAAFRPAPGGLPGPAGAVFNGRGATTFGGNYPGSRGNPGMNGGGNGGNNPGGLGNNGLNFGNPSARNNTYNPASQIPPGMTPETQVLLIEANRMRAQQQGDTEGAAILPITEMTPDASQ